MVYLALGMLLFVPSIGFTGQYFSSVSLPFFIAVLVGMGTFIALGVLVVRLPKRNPNIRKSAVLVSAVWAFGAVFPLMVAYSFVTGKDGVFLLHLLPFPLFCVFWSLNRVWCFLFTRRSERG